MKRWVGGVLLILFLLATSLPLGVVRLGPRPLAAPMRSEPNVVLTRTATGEKITLPMEEYVTGVVAAEMGDSFPLEALAAQAILARTYSLRRLHMGVPLTDDPGTVQAYDPDRITEKIRQAVDRTRGAVVTHQGQLVDAVYHACAGGRTATASEGMEAPDKAYLRPVSDPPCPRDEVWSSTMPAAEVASAFGLSGPVNSVSIGRRGPSGRALTLVANGKSMNIFKVRAALGSNRLKSTYLTGVSVEGNQVRVSGRGFGHGVGLSQWGAAALAEQGRTAEQIIRHYFTDVEVALYW